MRTSFYILLCITILSSCSNPSSFEFVTTGSSVNDTTISLENGIHTISILNPECPLSLKQVNTIKLLSEEFDSAASFIIVVPGIVIDAHSFVDMDILKDYDVPVFIDRKMDFCETYRPTVTPEFFLFNNNDLVYRGKLDNRQRTINLESNSDNYINYLGKAINEVIAGKEVEQDFVEPIGCYIEY